MQHPWLRLVNIASLPHRKNTITTILTVQKMPPVRTAKAAETFSGNL